MTLRSVTVSLAAWPKVEGVLREVRGFAECSMCVKDSRLGGPLPEWTTVCYGGEPTCLEHARELSKLREKARYARAARERAHGRATEKPEAE